MKVHFYILVALSSGALSLPAQAPPHAAGATHAVTLTPEFINQLADEMRTNNPTLRAADARALAAGLNVLTVRGWEDPMIFLGGTTAERAMRAEDGDLIYGLEQKVPLFGKPKYARGVAAAEAATAKATVTYAFQLLRRDLAKAAFEAALAERIVAIGREDLAWLDTMVATTEQRYRNGDGTLVELLRMQNERAKRATQLTTDSNVVSQARFVINRLLNRDLHAPWPQLDLPPVAGPVRYNRQLVRFASSYEPRIKVMELEIKQAAAVAQATRASRLPDVSVGIEGRQYSGNADLRQGMFTVSLSLPWMNRDKYRRDLERERAKVKATEAELAAYALQVQEDVHHLTVEIDAARREALLYRDEILARSQDALASAHAAWIANRGMFLDLMEARRMYLEAHLRYARAVAQQWILMSELVLCCGLGDLEALQMIGAQPDAEPRPEKQP
jgi:outer membrane protein TolC